MPIINKIFCKSSENMSEIKDNSVDLIVTSPPYNINIKYGNKWKNRKIIKSKSVKYKDNFDNYDYQDMIKKVFSECVRVLKKNGSFYLNMKNQFLKDSIITPFWILDILKKLYLKNIIIWNFDWGGSTSNRFSSRYEYVFFFTKNKSNWTFNLNDISIPSVNYRPDRYKTQFKNPSDVWKIPLVSGNSHERTNHPAQYPEKLIERIILASTNKKQIVLDPFMGSGTTAVVSKRLKRYYVGYEIHKKYIDIANQRLKNYEK
jgi:DNA modification methylase